MEFDVYNLEFRYRCHEMTIADYRFARVDEYEARLRELQHSITSHGEFSIHPCTGSHQVTARVTVPDLQPLAILDWSDSRTTALSDITLLLSIFTGRQVFALPSDPNGRDPRILLADPRQVTGSGVIQLSIPYVESPPRDETDPELTGDDGLQVGINKVYELMRTEEWCERYRKGYYLFLFRTALEQRTIESAFSQCWTIWEHLFSILNDSWMTRDSIRQTNATDKIAYLLVTYAVKERLQDKEKARLRALAEIRNRLIHYGELPVGSRGGDDAMLFIHMTEWIVAKTLELVPPETFDTLDRFEKFLSNTSRTA